VLLSWHDTREMTASFPGVMWYWQLFGLLQVTAGYTSTFVAQYTGAGRPHRVGPAVWRGIHFALLAGLLMLLLWPAAPLLIAAGAGWRLERELFGRRMKCGGPAGAQVFLDVLVFNLFVQLVGRLGEAAMGATTLTVRLNMIAFLPMMGMGQAVCILVGQRLGADRPDLAEKSAYTGLKWSFGYMGTVAAVYLLFPHFLVSVFVGYRD